MNHSCKNSTSTRIVYASLLFLGVIVAGIFLIPELQPQLAKIDTLCDTEAYYDKNRTEVLEGMVMEAEKEKGF